MRIEPGPMALTSSTEVSGFFPETGTPIWKMARRSVVFAVWLPEPFTVATWIEKLLFAVNLILASKCKSGGQETYSRLPLGLGQARFAYRVVGLSAREGLMP